MEYNVESGVKQLVRILQIKNVTDACSNAAHRRVHTANLNVINSAKEDWYRVLQYRLDQAAIRVGRLEGGLEKDTACHRFYSTYTARTFPKKLMKGLETSK
jgi:hypothetical protein